MAAGAIIQTADLEQTFNALKNQDPAKVLSQQIPNSNFYKPIPSQNLAPTVSVHGFNRFASASSNAGIVYGQPQFFSPVHTPINWQIPSKRLEEYQWARFFYCFTPENKVLMANGREKKICEVIVGDKIIDENGTPQTVLGIHTRNINEDILSFKLGGNNNVKISVTNSHEIKIVEKETWEKSCETVWSEKKKQERLNKFGKTLLLETWREAKNIRVGDYLISPELKPNTKGFMPDILSNNMCWLLGLFAADGSYYWYTYKNERKYPKGIRITLANDEKETIGKKVSSTINEELGLKTKEYKNGTGGCCDFVLHNVVMAKLFFSIVGEGSLTKSICQEFINNASEEQLLNFIAGFSDGDGCMSNGMGDQIRTASPYLALQLGIICTKTNLTHSHNWQEDVGKSFGTDKIYTLDKFLSCCIRISRESCEKFKGICEKYKKLTKANHHKIREYVTLKNKTYRKIIGIDRVNYCGIVYDLEVESNHTYCVNGCVVHNSNEPKVASAIDFYSFFPMNDYENECKDRKIKKYFDKLKKRLELPKWLRLMSHEIHLLGDCFPFIEVSCPICGGAGRTGDEICEHEGGTLRRIVLLNPDYIEVYTSPMNPDPLISLRPDEELTNMVQRKSPGYDRLTPQVRAMIASGRPIPLDNRSISHLKYGESGYARFGIGMVRRLFPILSYKTKLMVAQWIVAERLIVPIKIVKVGSDERPAGPADIAAVQAQLAQTSNDPNLTIVTHHAFEIDFIGAAGKVLTLSTEFEFINQEILDGMMINNALLNGEGPNFGNAAVGIEAMIERLETFRREVANWIEQKIYLPEAKRQGFIDEDAADDDDTENKGDEETEYIYPKIKWNSMHLRDQQQFRTFVLQLYEKGLLSAQTVLEAFDFNPDQEIERKRYDAVQQAALGEGLGQMGLGGQPGAAGGMGGGFAGMGGGMGGGMPGMPGGEGGAPSMPGMPGGEGGGGGAPISAPGAGAAPAMATSLTSLSQSQSQSANPLNYGGKVLKEKTRERMDAERQKTYKSRTQTDPGAGLTGMRDLKGRIIFTKPERELLNKIAEYRTNGLIRYPIIPQFEVQYGGIAYPIDFAIPHLKIGVEADGETFHSSPKQMIHDKERDMKLSQVGWTILRFTDKEIENRLERVLSTILKTIMQKEALVDRQKASLK